MGSVEQFPKRKTIKIDAIASKWPEFHFKVSLKDTDLVGIALEPAKAGEKVRIARRGFHTDYGGDFFFNCLDKISSLFLTEWLSKHKLKESKISNALIFIDRSRNSEVFINCPTFMEVTMKESSQNNKLIRREDISDIHKVFFSGVHQRSDCAVIYIFTEKWRRGIYFDFLPIDLKSPSFSGDLNFLFGSCYAYLIFPEIYRYEENPDLKLKLYSSGWFPFIRILGRPFTEIFNALQNDLEISEIEDKIISSIDEEAIHEMLKRWITNQLFEKRESFLKKGIEEYFEKDYISAIHVLFPCIEGIINDLSFQAEIKGDSGEKLTTKLVMYLKSQNPETRLLLPNNFKEYLINSYFAKFDKNSEDIDLSRHSLAHGAAIDINDYSQVRSLQAILILDQLSYYVESKPESSSVE